MMIALILSLFLNVVLILIQPSTMDSIERLLEKSIDRRIKQ